MQFATEKPDAPYEIDVYPGANATFTIYEDDNETYNYEKGQRATFDLSWNDAKKMLAIGPRKGTFPGLVKNRDLKVVVVNPPNDGNTADAKIIHYSGQSIIVNFDKH